MRGRLRPYPSERLGVIDIDADMNSDNQMMNLYIRVQS